MTWTFRLRFQVAEGYLLDLEGLTPHDDDSELRRTAIGTSAGDFELLMPTPKPNSRQVGVITGSGYANETLARSAGEDVRSATRLTAVRNGIPMDLGDDRVVSALGPSVREAMEKEGELQVRPVVHGLDVFEQFAETVVVFHAHANLHVSKPVEQLVNGFSEAMNQAATTSPQVSLAGDVFLSALFETSARARILTYVTALEVAAEKRDRISELADLVVKLSEHVQTARRGATPDHQKAYDSLLGGVRALTRESLRASVARVAEEHTPFGKLYSGLPAERFASRAYTVRSDLVHEGESDEGSDLRGFAGNLHFLVQDVLVSLMRG